MADPVDSDGVVDATVETFVLAFDLADDIVLNAPKTLGDALLSADVQKEIKKVLEDFVKERLNKAPTAATKEDGDKLRDALLKAGAAGIKSAATHEIKESAKYKALDASLKKLTAALKKSPTGVWVDRHEKVLYILGAVAILGGATAMYVTRTGDTVTNLVFPLEGGKSLLTKKLGKLKLDVGYNKIHFVPSERLVETKTYIKGKWDQIEVTLNLALTAADGTVTAKADGAIVVPVTKRVNLKIGSTIAARDDWSLNATVNLTVQGSLQLGIMAGVGQKMATPGAIGGSGAKPDDNRFGGFIGLGLSGSF